MKIKCLCEKERMVGLDKEKFELSKLETRTNILTKKTIYARWGFIWNKYWHYHN